VVTGREKKGRSMSRKKKGAKRKAYRNVKQPETTQIPHEMRLVF
jgi:hypothetical protein